MNCNTTLTLNPGSILDDLIIAKQEIQARIAAAEEQLQALQRIKILLAGPAQKLLEDANRVIDNLLGLSKETRLDFVVVANSLLLRSTAHYRSAEDLQPAVIERLGQIASSDERRELYAEYRQKTITSLTQSIMPRGIHLEREMEILRRTTAWCQQKGCEKDIAYHARAKSSQMEYPLHYNILNSATAGQPNLAELFTKAVDPKASRNDLRAALRKVTDCLFADGPAGRRKEIQKRMGQLIALNQG